MSIEIRAHPGYSGVFTTHQAEGMLPNGTRIRKTVFEDGDPPSRPVGATGTVLGSLSAGGLGGYFIEWDSAPRLAVFIAAYKVAAL